MPHSWKRRLFGKWSWKRPFISLGLVYLILCGITFLFANFFIFPAPENPSYDENTVGLQFVKASDGNDIALLHFPAQAGMPTILASHGNAEDLGNFSSMFRDFTNLGYGILVYDYPGYGLSSGKPSESGTYASIQSAWNYLIETRDMSPDDIIIFGRSVGSGPSTWLAANDGSEARALVLLSPFLSAYRTVTRYPLFPGDKFPNIDWIAKKTPPVLIFHGQDDEVIPFSHGETLFKIAKAQRKLFIPLPDTNHNNLTNSWRTIVRETINFTSSRITM